MTPSNMSGHIYGVLNNDVPRTDRVLRASLTQKYILSQVFDHSVNAARDGRSIAVVSSCIFLPLRSTSSLT
jgi:hypothetical protein